MKEELNQSNHQGLSSYKFRKKLFTIMRGITLSINNHISIRTEAIILILQTLQSLTFLFDYPYWPWWRSTTLNVKTSLFIHHTTWLPFFKYNSSWFLIATGWINVFVIIWSYVFIRFLVIMEGREAWTNSRLFTTTSLLLYVVVKCWYYPFFSILASAITCNVYDDDNYNYTKLNCDSPWFIVVTVVSWFSIFSLIFLGIVVSWFVFNTNINEADPKIFMQSTSQNYSNNLLGSTLLLVLFLVLHNQREKPNDLIGIGSVFIVSGFRLYFFISENWLVYNLTTKIDIFNLCVLCYGSILWFIAKACENSDFDFNILFLFGCVVLLALLISIPTMPRWKFDKSRNVHYIKNQLVLMAYYAEKSMSDECRFYKINLLEYISNYIKNNSNDHEENFKRYIDSILHHRRKIWTPAQWKANNAKLWRALYLILGQIYKYFLLKQGNPLLLKLSYIWLLKEKLGWHEKAYREWLSLGIGRDDLSSVMTVEYEYIVYCNKICLENEGNIKGCNGVIKHNEISFRYYYTELIKDIKVITNYYLKFWGLLSSPFSNLTIVKLSEYGNKIISNMNKIDLTFTSLQRIKNNDKRVLYAYMIYLEKLLNNKTKADMYKMILFLASEEKDIFTYNNNNKIQMINTSYLDANMNINYILVKATKEDGGVIQKISLNICSLLGYTYIELLNKNIDMIMPDFLREVHREMWIKKMGKIQISIGNSCKGMRFKAVLIYVKTKSKYILPFPVEMWICPNENNENCILWKYCDENYFMKNKCYVMTNKELHIKELSSNSLKVLGFVNNKMNSNIEISSYIKEFHEDCLQTITSEDAVGNKVNLKIQILQQKYCDHKAHEISWKEEAQTPSETRGSQNKFKEAECQNIRKTQFYMNVEEINIDEVLCGFVFCFERKAQDEAQSACSALPGSPNNPCSFSNKRINVRPKQGLSVEEFSTKKFKIESSKGILSNFKYWNTNTAEASNFVIKDSFIPKDDFKGKLVFNADLMSYEFVSHDNVNSDVENKMKELLKNKLQQNINTSSSSTSSSRSSSGIASINSNCDSSKSGTSFCEEDTSSIESSNEMKLKQKNMQSDTNKSIGHVDKHPKDCVYYAVNINKIRFFVYDFTKLQIVESKSTLFSEMETKLKAVPAVSFANSPFEDNLTSDHTGDSLINNTTKDPGKTANEIQSPRSNREGRKQMFQINSNINNEINTYLNTGKIDSSWIMFMLYNYLIIALITLTSVLFFVLNTQALNNMEALHDTLYSQLWILLNIVRVNHYSCEMIVWDNEKYTNYFQDKYVYKEFCREKLVKYQEETWALINKLIFGQAHFHDFTREIIENIKVESSIINKSWNAVDRTISWISSWLELNSAWFNFHRNFATKLSGMDLNFQIMFYNSEKANAKGMLEMLLIFYDSCFSVVSDTQRNLWILFSSFAVFGNWLPLILHGIAFRLVVNKKTSLVKIFFDVNKGFIRKSYNNCRIMGNESIEDNNYHNWMHFDDSEQWNDSSSEKDDNNNDTAEAGLLARTGENKAKNEKLYISDTNLGLIRSSRTFQCFCYLLFVASFLIVSIFLHFFIGSLLDVYHVIYLQSSFEYEAWRWFIYLRTYVLVNFIDNDYLKIYENTLKSNLSTIYMDKREIENELREYINDKGFPGNGTYEYKRIFRSNLCFLLDDAFANELKDSHYSCETFLNNITSYGFETILSFYFDEIRNWTIFADQVMVQAKASGLSRLYNELWYNTDTYDFIISMIPEGFKPIYDMLNPFTVFHNLALFRDIMILYTYVIEPTFLNIRTNIVAIYREAFNYYHSILVILCSCYWVFVALVFGFFYIPRRIKYANELELTKKILRIIPDEVLHRAIFMK